MPLAKHSVDLVLRFLHLTGRNRGELDHVDLRLARQALHHRCVRSDDGVVLVLPHHVSALLVEDAEDLEGHVLDAYDLAHRFAVGKEVVDDRAAEDTDLRRALHVLIAEEGALRNIPGADERIVFAHALNRRSPVELSGHDLRGGAYGW